MLRQHFAQRQLAQLRLVVRQLGHDGGGGGITSPSTRRTTQ